MAITFCRFAAAAAWRICGPIPQLFGHQA